MIRVLGKVTLLILSVFLSNSISLSRTVGGGSSSQSNLPKLLYSHLGPYNRRSGEPSEIVDTVYLVVLS